MKRFTVLNVSATRNGQTFDVILIMRSLLLRFLDRKYAAIFLLMNDFRNINIKNQDMAGFDWADSEMDQDSRVLSARLMSEAQTEQYAYVTFESQDAGELLPTERMELECIGAVDAPSTPTLFQGLLSIVLLISFLACAVAFILDLTR